MTTEPLRPSAAFTETKPGLWVRRERLDEDREAARRERLAGVMARLGQRITTASKLPTFDREAAREAAAKATTRPGTPVSTGTQQRGSASL